jgi:beta-phosphoglucomutase family hydrolase
MPRRFDAVLFDMDGVLVDSEPLHNDAIRELLAGYGVSCPDEMLEEFVGTRDVDMFRELCARHALRDDPETLAARRTALTVTRIERGVPAMTGVPDVPARLAADGYPLAVASSSTPEIIEAVLRVLGIRPLFQAVVSSAGLAHGKPAPDVFLEAARTLGAAPERCVVVEDAPHGVAAAKAAGMSCIAVPCAFTRHLDFSAADWRLESLTALPHLLASVGLGGHFVALPSPI